MQNDVTAAQIALYGEPLGDRIGRLLAAYRIPQSRLAAVIGLSAPMLSQLAGGHRVKISNPGVYARLLRLEELSRSPALASGAQAVIDAALAQVAGSHPQLTTDGMPDAHSVALAHLAAVATAPELQHAASAVPGSRLAGLLTEAATHLP